MFKNIFETIVDKISNLNPIRHFIKYALDKTLNQFLAKQLTLEDFKNGPLNLNNIEINCKKINQAHLVGSPYILHHGIIGYLRISLPPLSQISTKSIQIIVENVQVSLKPNKNFAQNFKQKMFELNDMQKFYVQEKQIDGQISENGPVDFFKQLLKNIIMNIKIKVRNIVVKLYMNTPSQNSSHPQFYTMLRIPMIHLQKKEQKQVNKSQIQQIKFSILVPQISLHLLRQDSCYPDYANVECKKGDFPFTYPTVQHPSTILLIGSPTIPENLVEKLPELHQTNEIKNYEFSNFSFSLCIDYTKKTKELQLFLDVDNFQVMVSALQLKILSRFIIQIMQFKKILKNIIEQIKLETGQSLMLHKKKSGDDFNGNSDFFSSFMMSISNDIGPQGLSRSKSSGNKDIFASIINENKSIKADVDKFNQQCTQEFRKTLKTIPQVSRPFSLQQFQAINFKNIVTFNAQLSILRIFLLKYSTLHQYKRHWQTKLSSSLINQKIGSSYYQFFITKSQLQYRINEKILDANFKNIKIYHAKLRQNSQHSSIDDYYDIKDSVEFYSMNKSVQDAKTLINNNRKSQIDVHEIKLFDFQLGTNNHYCVEQMLKINQDQEQQKCVSSTVMKYSLIPKFQTHKSDAYILYKPGFSIHLDQKQNYSKINIEMVSVSVNFEILQDLLNIIYPIFNYRRVSDMISYKREQLDIPTNHKKSLFESQYQCRIDMVKSSEAEKQAKRNILVLQVSQVKIGFRKGKQVCSFTNLVKKSKQKMYDEDSFSKQCFCKINQNSCLYVQLYGIQLKKKAMIKFSCKKIQAGLYDLKNSTIVNLSSLLILDSIRQDDGFKFFKEELNATLITIFVPGITVKLMQKQINPMFNVIIDSLKIIDYLMAYKHFLENQMSMIERQSSQIIKKSRKSDATDKQIKIFIDKVFIDTEIVLLKLQKIFFTKSCDGIVVKTSSFVAGLKRDVRVKICQFRNQSMLLNQYSRAARHQQIPDSDVFLEIYDSKKNPMTFKSMQKQNFFEKLSKQSFTINLNLSKKDSQNLQNDSSRKQYPTLSSKHSSTSSVSSNNTFSQKFRFKHMNSTIEQQGHRLMINLQLTKNLHIYACNALELLKQKQRIMNLVKQINCKNKQFQQIKSQSVILDRKHSSQIQNETIQILLKFSEVLVDIRPEFISKDNEKIYGPTRSVVSLDIGETSIHINKQKKLNQISSTLNILLYFLYSDDRQLQLSPILLRQDPLQFNQMGYKLILQITKLALQLKNNNNRNLINLKIKNILAECSLKTITLIKLHSQHLVNHHIKKQIGLSLQQIYQNDQFCNLEDNDHDNNMGNIEDDDIIMLEPDDEDFFVEDLSQALEQYEIKINLKKNDQKQLKMRGFEANPIPNSILCIESFILEKLTIRISCGNDFNFLHVPNLGSSSSAQKRCRAQHFEQQRFITVNLINLYLQLDIDSSKIPQKLDAPKKLDLINAFAKLQKIKVTVSRQKNIGYNTNTLKLIEQQIQQQMFTLCWNQNQLCVILESSPQKMIIKTYSLKIKLGITSQIVTLMKLWKTCDKQIQRSGWKKIYDCKQIKKNKEGKEKMKQKILVLIPESTIKFSLQYENLMLILDEQKVVTTELLLNEEISNQYVIRRKVRKWVKQLIKDNLGSLISRTALNLLFKLISQIIALNINFIGKILGFLFGSSE